MQTPLSKFLLITVIAGVTYVTSPAQAMEFSDFCSFLIHRAGRMIGLAPRPYLPATYSLIHVNGVPQGVTITCSSGELIQTNTFRVGNLQTDRFYEVVLAYRVDNGPLLSADLHFQGGEMMEIQFDHLVSIALP